MRGVKCTAPDGTTVLLRSAKAVTQHIKASTGEDVSEYFVNETAADAGELLGFQLSHATDEEQQQLLWGGVTQPDKEVSAAGAICRDAICYLVLLGSGIACFLLLVAIGIRQLVPQNIVAPAGDDIHCVL